MGHYQPRRLPHWDPGDAALYITWRLKGSFPAEREWEVLPTKLELEHLDQGASGPQWMKDPAVADCVTSTILFGAEKLALYELYAWVVMSNHVHILVEPLAPMARITKSIKNYSARECNKILGLSGPFWLSESFDRWVRTGSEFDDIVRYIEFNPVTAGLVATPEEWRWSSAWQRVGREAYPTKGEGLIHER